MLKGIITFALTRRPIVLLGLLVFIGVGVAALSKLNIEAYPNPAPVILEITAQAAGQSAEEMERYYTIPIEVGLAATPGVDIILRPFVCAGDLQIRHRLLFCRDAGGLEPAAERQPSEQRVAHDPGLKPGGRGLSLPGGRPAPDRAH